MKLIRFSYNISTVDVLSHAPESSSVTLDIQQEAETGVFIRSLMKNISVNDKCLEEIRPKQNVGRVCRQVINYWKMDH